MMQPPHGADPEDYYVKQDRVGKGSFGEVYKGFDKRSRQPVAIKIIDLENAEDEIDDIQQEIAILSQLDSAHVTKYVFPVQCSTIAIHRARLPPTRSVCSPILSFVLRLFNRYHGSWLKGTNLWIVMEIGRAHV